MAPNRRLGILLLLLVVSLGALVVSRGGFGSFAGPLDPPPAPEASTGAPPGETPRADAPQAARSPAFPDVNLEGLQGTRQEPLVGGRNPFSMRAGPTSSLPDSRPEPPVTGPSPVTPAETPAVALTSRALSIPLKFIGIVNLSGDRGKLAVLSDGDFVYHGRQGDVVEGRYRIVSIGDESIELEHTDGRGRQSLPLTGS